MRQLPVIGTALVLALVPLTQARAQEKIEVPKPATPPAPAPAVPVVKKIDPEAQKSVDSMVKAYQTLKSLSGTMTFSAERGTDKKSLTTVFSLARPNKVSVKVTAPSAAGTPATHLVISDGKKLFAHNSEKPDSYLADAAEADPINIVEAFGMSGGAGTGLFGLLVADPKVGAKVLGPDATVLEFGPDEKIGGIDSKVVKATLHRALPNGTFSDVALSFAIGKTDSLLRRLTVSSASPQGNYILTELYTDIKVNPALTDKDFTFVPPPGAKAEESPKEQP